MSAIDCMVVVAHADDEALSCGGLIHRRIALGMEVSVIAVFGRTYDYGKGAQYIQEQSDAFNSSCDLLGVGKREVLNFKEGEPSQQSYYQVLERLESALALQRPTKVVIHDDQDRNQDHRWLSDVCKIALRPFGAQYVDQILMCQSPDGLSKLSNYYVPVKLKSRLIMQKAVECYGREARGGTHPRSPVNLEAWHRLNGSFCGEECAEPYRLYYQRE